MRSGSLLFNEEKSSNGLLSATKVVFFWSDFYETWSSRKIRDLQSYFIVQKLPRRACLWGLWSRGETKEEQNFFL